MSDFILTSPAFSGPRVPAWGVFDPAWYRLHYGARVRQDWIEAGENSKEDRSPDDAWLERHWYERGARAGFSPNAFFDELWYLRENEDVRNAVRRDEIFDSGFLHYCESGYRSRSPHWLFSAEHYFRENPDLNPGDLRRRGFVNGYDHYLREGDQEQRSAHLFFDAAVYQTACFAARAPYDFGRSGYVQFLETSGAGEGLRTSWYFDPAWYVARYNDVRIALEQGRFESALHHYLTNDTPDEYDPNPWFSEEHYRERNPDVSVILAGRGFRNGYDHFVRYGALERRSPHPDVDLAAYASRPEIKAALRTGKGRDAFALWVHEQANLRPAPVIPPVSSGQYHVLGLERARSLLPSAIRARYVFGGADAAVMSVVIVARNRFHDLLSTLAALQANDPERLDVIVVDAGSTDETRHLERFVRGITVLRPHPRLDFSAQRALAVEQASAARVLLLAPGVQPFPGVLRMAISIAQETSAVLLGGQLLDASGTVRAAGSIVWRDGKVSPYGAGLRPNAPEIAFRRSVDALTGGFILGGRSDILDALDTQPPLHHRFDVDATLCLTVAVRGGAVVYDPAILARTCDLDAIDTPSDVPHRANLRRFFGDALSRQPMSHVPLARARTRGTAPTILVLCEKLPRARTGGQAWRLQAVIRYLASAGYGVTLFALDGSDGSAIFDAIELPPTVEVMSDCDQSTLASFIESRSGCFDYLWLAGTPVLQRTATILQDYAADLPTRGNILDTGTLHALEEHRRRLVGCLDDQERLLSEAGSELEKAWICQTLVASNAEEAMLLQRLGFRGVHVLGHAVTDGAPGSSPDFEQRSGLLFALPILHPGDAVHDGFDWFFQNVIGRLDALLPEDATLLVAGYRGPAVNLAPYGRYPRIEVLPDNPDLAHEMKTRRVMIAPTRVTGGQPAEVLAAAAQGLPSVVGNNIANQLGWTQDDICLDGGTSDAERFAQATARLYLDRDLWTRLSRAGMRKASEQASRESFGNDLARILHDAHAHALPQETDLSPACPPKARIVLAPAPLKLQPRVLPASSPASIEKEDEDQDDGSAFRPRLGLSFN